MEKAYITTYHELNLNNKNRDPYYINLDNTVHSANVQCQEKIFVI